VPPMRTLLGVFTLLLATIGHGAELASLGSIRPQASSEIAAAPWGVQFNPLAPHIPLNVGDWREPELAATTDRLVAATARLGAKWVRFSINWSTVQDAAGEFHWDYVDRAVRGLVARRITPFICLNGGHRAFTRAMSVRTEAEFVAWLRFVDAVTQRYGNDVKHWEIWNEPNTVWFWKPAPVAAEYVELVRRTTPVIKRNIPGARVLGGSVARLDLPYAEEALRLGLAAHIDVFTIHPYGEMPEAILRPVRVPVKTPVQYLEADHPVVALQELLRSKSIPVWQAECGYASTANSLGWTGNGPWGEIIQAKWLLRRMLTDLAFGSEISCYFTLVDFQEGNPEKMNTKGLLRLRTLAEKPAYRVFQNCAAVLQGSLPVEAAAGGKVEAITSEGSFFGAKPRDVMLLRLRSDRGPVLAYWLPWRAQEKVDAAATAIAAEGFNDPVLVDLLRGEVFALPRGGTRWGDLPLADWPLLIAEKAVVAPALRVK
jgi:hypothetical protein